MTTWNRQTVTDLVLRAARIALKHFDSPVKEFKADESVVTQADREIEQMLSESLDAPEKGSYLIGEETLHTRTEEYIQAGLRGKAWIIDPIDGTSSYANHFPMWGISLAYAEGGVIKEGALYLPVGGEFLISEGERIYFGRVRPSEEASAVTLAPFSPGSVRPDKGGIISIAQGFAKHGGFEGINTVHATGCCVFSLVHLMLGGYISYVADLKLWDLAAGIALLEKLGFIARFEDGRPFTTKIDAAAYRLEPGDPRRWKARGRIIFGRDEAATEYTAARFSGPGDKR